MTSEVESMERLKTIAEQNLTEALAMLQQEREHRHNIKKELDQRIASESMFGLHNLSLLSLNDARSDDQHTPGGSTAIADADSRLHGHHIDEGVDHNPALKQIEANFSSPKYELRRPAPAPPRGLVGDLFSEVHVGEIQKLERILEQTEIEKSGLERALEESAGRLADAMAEAEARSADVAMLKAQLEQASASPKTPSTIPGADPVVVEKFPNYKSAVAELSSLTRECKTIEGVNRQVPVAIADGLEAETAIQRLEVKLADECQVSDELRQSLGQMKDGLRQLCISVAQFYATVCEHAGEKPDKAVMFNGGDDVKGLVSCDQSFLQTVEGEVSKDSDDVEVSSADVSTRGTSSGDFDASSDGPPAVVCYELIELVQKQIQSAMCVFYRLMESSQRPCRASIAANVDEVTELQEQV